MISGSIAKRYTRALFELAESSGDTTEIGAALTEIGRAVAGIAGDALTPGTLTQSEREQLGAAVAGAVGAQSTLGKFVRLLAEKDRLGILPQVAEWFIRMQDEAAGRSRLKVESATPLGESELREVADAFKRLAGRDVVPEASVNSDLIGGIVVELEGRVYDGSVKTHLARLAENMAGK